MRERVRQWTNNDAINKAIKLLKKLGIPYYSKYAEFLKTWLMY